MALPHLLAGRGSSFEALDGMPGFRSLRGGATSASGDPLAGLMPRAPTSLPAPVAVEEPCALLARPRAGTVPVTLFTDVACGVCRSFEPLLDARAGDTITLMRLPLPLLGEVSVAAARATVAAARQGAGDRMHARLMRSRFQPGPAYLAAMAEGLSLDADRLIADAASDETTLVLAQSRGLAARFRLYATPSMVVGRTAVLGALDGATLDRLIAEEAALPPICA